MHTINNPSEMKYLFAFILMFASLCCAAATTATDTTGINTNTAVTITSDTVLDDTSDYVVSTHIPKGFIQKLNKFGDEAVNDNTFSTFKIFNAMCGFADIGVFIMIFLFFVFPLLIIALLIRYVLRNRNKAKQYDLYQTPYNVRPDENTAESNRTKQQNKKQNYTHRRDNAIRNMCIGGGVTLISLYVGLGLIAVAGIVVFGIGISDYLICRNHRDDEN